MPATVAFSPSWPGGSAVTAATARSPASFADRRGSTERFRSGAAKPLTEVRSPPLSTWARSIAPKTGTPLYCWV